MDVVQKLTEKLVQKNENLPKFKTGDEISVHVKVKEGEKERIQIFKGVVIKLQGSGTTRAFTVRKMSSGTGVERTWPLTSPALDKIELLKIGKIRRSRIYYLRNLRGRAAKIKSELVTQTKKAKKPKNSKEAKETAAKT